MSSLRLHLALGSIAVPAAPTKALTEPVPTCVFDEQPESEPAVLIDAAVQYLPLATTLVLNFRPPKWILYVWTGFDSVPSSVLMVLLNCTPTGLGFFFEPPLAILPVTEYWLVPARATAAKHNSAATEATTTETLRKASPPRDSRDGLRSLSRTWAAQELRCLLRIRAGAGSGRSARCYRRGRRARPD